MLPSAPALTCRPAPHSHPALALALCALPLGNGHGEGTPRPLAIPAPLLNHGPGTSGGGSATASGETLRSGRWEVALRSVLTGFERVGRSEAEARAVQTGEFDALRRSVVETLSVAYGLTDDLQLGLATGYYAGTDFIDAEEDGLGGVESATADPHGITDLWLSAKWRVKHDAGGHVALIGGIKLPTGKDDVSLSNGEPLEPSSQPGSGAVDLQAGAAYSRYLTPRVTFDASMLYTLRGEHDDFTVGDRADLGVALAYRITEDVRAPDNWSVFGELTGLWLGKDEADGVTNENSGGSILYLSLGARERFDEHVSLSLAPSIPVLQDVNGEQVEVDYRVALTLAVTL